MKKHILFFALILSSALGVSQDLPQHSQLTKIEQRVGLTDITIEYSRPNVNKRKVFGELISYDTIWRLGANSCTKFTTSSSIDFGGKVLKAGEYALFATISEKGVWTLHFNSNSKQWGAYDYDPELDVLTISEKGQRNQHKESLDIHFDWVNHEKGLLALHWHEQKVTFKFTVPTSELAQRSIEEATKKGEKQELVYSNAAEYYLEFAKDTKLALKYASESIKIKETLNGFFIKASVLKEMDNMKEANKFLDKAIKMAKDEKKENWVGYLNRTKTNWNKKK